MGGGQVQPDLQGSLECGERLGDAANLDLAVDGDAVVGSRQIVLVTGVGRVGGRQPLVDLQPLPMRRQCFRSPAQVG